MKKKKESERKIEPEIVEGMHYIKSISFKIGDKEATREEVMEHLKNNIYVSETDTQVKKRKKKKARRKNVEVGQ